MVSGILSVVASVDSVVGQQGFPAVLSSEGVVSGISSVVGTGVVSQKFLELWLILLLL